VRSTRSRRHLKNLSHGPKEEGNLGNVGKVEIGPSGHEKAEGDLLEVVAEDRVEIEIGEENGVDRKG
jgi:hypothetical protein